MAGINALALIPAQTFASPKWTQELKHQRAPCKDQEAPIL
jgi:hypothetical protein